MRQIAIIAAGLLLTISSCTTSGSGSGTSVTPATSSTFNITYNGKTYHLTSTTTAPITVVTAMTNSSSATGTTFWTASAGASNNHIQCSIGGGKFTDLSNATGVYKGGCGGGTTYSALNLTDLDDGNKRYETDCTGHDTTSTLTITTSNATEVKGTFNVILTYNGNYYPATGDFDYKH